MRKERIPISYFMPAYNCEATVAESVASIARQPLQEGDELVIVNDGSTDRTAEVLDELRRRFAFIRVVTHRKNRGGGAARNTAVENAVNPLLFCLDSDNVLEPDSIPSLIAFLQATGADAAAFQQLRYFSKTPGEVTHTWTFEPRFVTLADVMSNYIVPPASGNYLFTLDSWARAGGYPEFAGAYDAWGFGFRQLATGSSIAVMPDSWYHHRAGHDSYWIRFARAKDSSLAPLQIVLPFLDRFEDEDVEYMMGAEGRYAWFQNFATRPIRVKGQGVTTAGRLDAPPASLLRRAARAVRRLL